MELKEYQKTVLDDLEDFLSHLNRADVPAVAFRDYWADRHIRVDSGPKSLRPYREAIKGVPSACLKVPTAGGKTFLGLHAVHRFYQSCPLSPAKVVVWLVPSLTILDQTLKNFRDADHPYRQKWDALFQGRLQILSKDEALTGTGFSPEAARTMLTVVVLSFDSFRTQNKEGRKVYQENGSLTNFASTYTISKTIENADPTSLAQVLNNLNPMVVVDESHNAGSSLSLDMLTNLNPSFILELTATPRDTSNIVSYVDALALKKEQMVKLPVVVYNNHDLNEVIANALSLRGNLEKLASEEEAAGGSYIRPIVLFQAEPKSGTETVTFTRLKEKLVEFGIPKEEIAIKTAEINELKNVTLEDRSCPIRYIITINALKEGWDCPFAYILATLANRSSPVDVEQILGRILRQPYVRQHKKALLNMSYVLTSSAAFLDALDRIVAGLNRAGFSKNDYRVKAEQTVVPVSPPAVKERVAADLIDSIVPRAPSSTSTALSSAVQEIQDLALETDSRLRQVMDRSTDEPGLIRPFELQGVQDMFALKSQYREQAQKLKLPQFFEDADAGLFNDGEASLKLISKAAFLKNFKLSQQASDISMTSASPDAYKIDVVSYEAGEAAPEYMKLDQKELDAFVRYLNSLSPEDQKREMLAKVWPQLSRFDHIAESDLKDYIFRIFSSLTTEQLESVKQNPFAFAIKVKIKINQLSDDFAAVQFEKALAANRIFTKANWSFPKEIGPLETRKSLPKSLYLEEENPNDFELRVINEVANLENILFWHRNIERRGFRPQWLDKPLPGFHRRYHAREYDSPRNQGR
ncbi:DEAD/DEAH box helicase family protein [Treponema sp.]